MNKDFRITYTAVKIPATKTFTKKCKGAGGIAQQVKCLQFNHEDLSSDP